MVDKDRVTCPIRLEGKDRVCAYNFGDELNDAIQRQQVC